MSYEINEENEILDGEDKVAILDKGGKLRMSKGHADKREDVEAWLDAREAALPEKEMSAEEQQARKDHPGLFPAPSVAIKPKKGVPDPPPQDPMLGEKTPEYWAWFEKHYPEVAATRYKGWVRPQ